MMKKILGIDPGRGQEGLKFSLNICEHFINVCVCERERKYVYVCECVCVKTGFCMFLILISQYCEIVRECVCENRFLCVFLF